MTRRRVYLRHRAKLEDMPSANGEETAEATFRCRVCGREFDDREALERHVHDQGLLW